ncbi:hypothetical protein [Arcobacter sp. 15-2]|uniref:hypothetical protein n=1 Tax=Arcobacter sp. 15-2 TaxID=3374109 RepID=UPI00399CEEF9
MDNIILATPLNIIVEKTIPNIISKGVKIDEFNTKNIAEAKNTVATYISNIRLCNILIENFSTIIIYSL